MSCTMVDFLIIGIKQEIHKPKSDNHKQTKLMSYVSDILTNETLHRPN